MQSEEVMKNSLMSVSQYFSNPPIALVNLLALK